VRYEFHELTWLYARERLEHTLDAAGGRAPGGAGGGVGRGYLAAPWPDASRVA